MAEFSVWSPLREKVEVEIDNHICPMERAADGWWHTEVLHADVGSKYKLRLEGEASYPDPRSRFQPDGVHGVSQVVNPASFAWTDSGYCPPPLSSGVLYELHVGTFTKQGTFQAAVDKLPHLKKLGITHVEVMPIAEFAGTRGWGYDGDFLYAPHRAYGGPEGVVQFVNACHELGLAVLLDVVYNHLGPSGNYLPQFAPYFTDRHKTPWGAAVNFDGPYSDDVREFFIDNARMWLCDYHFDGLRLDAIHAIVDTSAFPFLEQLGQEVKHLEAQLCRQLVLIAESDLNDPRIIRSPERDGFGIHAQWNDDFHHAVHATLTNEKQGYYEDFGGVDDLACVFRVPYLYARRFSPHRLRSHGRAADRIPASSFIAYSQNHDQVGNRATGERLHHLVSTDVAKIAAALTILSPYVPMLFQGEEWAASSPFQYFVDFSDDPELAAAVTAGRQKEFEDFQHGKAPDPCSEKTFKDSKLNWNELEDDQHSEMLDWYKTLLQLRRKFPQLVDGRLDRVRAQFDDKNHWLLVDREGTFLIVNLAPGTSRITVPTQSNLTLIVSSREGIRLDGQNVIIPPNAMCLLAAENSAQMRGRHRVRGDYKRPIESQNDDVVTTMSEKHRQYQDAVSTIKKTATAGSS